MGKRARPRILAAKDVPKSIAVISPAELASLDQVSATGCAEPSRQRSLE